MFMLGFCLFCLISVVNFVVVFTTNSFNVAPCTAEGKISFDKLLSKMNGEVHDDLPVVIGKC